MNRLRVGEKGTVRPPVLVLGWVVPVPGASLFRNAFRRSPARFRWRAVIAIRMITKHRSSAGARPMSVTRFRLRTVMIAVAIVGVLLALGIEARRLYRVSAQHRARAAILAFEEANLRANVARQASLRYAVAAAAVTAESASVQQVLI